MILSNVRKDSDGDYEFDVKATDEEVSFLVTLALHTLISVGVLSVEEKEDEQEVQIPSINNTPPTVN